MPYLLRSAFVATGLLFTTGALAQQQPGWFVPPAGGGGGTASPRQGQAAPSRPVAPRPQPRPAAQPLVQVAPPGGDSGGLAGTNPPDAPPLQVQLPPMPDLPPIPRGPTPPAAVIGVLGIPDIMRASTAAQQVEKTIGERREKLTQDVQKEQAAWRELQQALVSQRASMTPDQIRAKEKELQDRVTNAQRSFRDRNRFMQEAAQVGLSQIERTLIGVIRQVAESRGMNLVLHRAQVALNVNEFDITEPVVEQMNKVMSTVQLPPEGVSAALAAGPAGKPNTPPDGPAAATPTAAPSGPPPRR
ncbi:MAG TPA: OmpH family outer membrane protein [Acetobacteraceae bacterium]